MPDQYYAITKYNTTKDDPLFVAHYKAGYFERFAVINGQWVKDNSLYDMWIGDLAEYEDITEAEAMATIDRQMARYRAQQLSEA